MSVSIEDIQAVKQRFGIIGNSPSINYAIQTAIQVAPTDLTVLITGESGSGKESFSKIIHNLSNRKHGKFIAINCGAIPEGTIDSELFGHEKGSFTGASEARKGYFEETDAGTIFLDEIGEMPLGTQARLLRVLENGEFIKVGSSKVQKTNVRIVAATNVNLIEAVKKKKFREDLYYRLSTVPIYVPPLRERGMDSELLFRKFAYDYAEQYKVKPLTLDQAAKDLLVKYNFPGNIRQLKNIVVQISALEYDRNITADTLAKYLPNINGGNNNLIGALVPAGEATENYSERDLLYKFIIDTRKDVLELKKLVLSIIQNEGHQNAILQTHKHLFQNLDDFQTVSEPEETHTPIIFGNNQVNSSSNNNTVDFERVEDVTHLVEEDTLSLEKKEKEMIIAALKKHSNRRKNAASALGISERTLYRKLKQYGLE